MIAVVVTLEVSLQISAAARHRVAVSGQGGDGVEGLPAAVVLVQRAAEHPVHVVEVVADVKLWMVLTENL